MFSDLQSPVFRPGAAHGRYPQRPVERQNWLDQQTAIVRARRKRRHLATTPHMQKVLSPIHDHAKTFVDLDDTQLAQWTKSIRHQLNAATNDPDAVAKAFALVRETSRRLLGMAHYDVQLYAGWTIFQGMLAEMQTGEGKTLTATLPAATAALAGIPVHVVTVNDYLAERDAELMRPVYAALGLSVGVVTAQLTTEERRSAYGCHITYCTNSQLAFDYLKDGLVLGRSNGRLQLELDRLNSTQRNSDALLLRGLCYAIVDEADGVLIDDARTPLVLSRQGDNKEQTTTFEQALAIAKTLERDVDFEINRSKQIIITGNGNARLKRATANLAGVWSGPRRAEELLLQALSALHLYTLDIDYVIRDDKLCIVDESTGRAMPDRQWERGLHQMVEKKEGLEISARNETIARISYQRFFSRYLRLGGMSGTALEVADELWSVYGLNVVTIAPRVPNRRLVSPDCVHITKSAKWAAIIAAAKARADDGQAVLIGTRTVADSEHVSLLLTKDELPHQVLNARQDQEEADIIAQAGETGRITVATNMAGRGTDIKLAPAVAASGGLHVIISERHEARRVDRQLTGRAARQGDAGSAQAILSLEDEIITTFLPAPLRWCIACFFARGGVLPRTLGNCIVRLAQRRKERQHSQIRRDLLKRDDELADVLAFSGRRE